MATIFSRIIAGEIPCYKVAETDRAIAFLDINPIQPGHVLVVPKVEVDYIFDLPEADYQHLHSLARRIAAAQRTATHCTRVAEAVIGLEVPHAHIHLVPINAESDLDFRQHVSQSAEQMQEMATAISQALLHE